jgi:hypothetical protein
MNFPFHKPDSDDEEENWTTAEDIENNS